MNSYHSSKNNNAIAYCECPSCYVLRPMRQLIAPEGTSLQTRVSIARVDLKPSSDAGDGLLRGDSLCGAEESNPETQTLHRDSCHWRGEIAHFGMHAAWRSGELLVFQTTLYCAQLDKCFVPLPVWVKGLIPWKISLACWRMSMPFQGKTALASVIREPLCHSALEYRPN